MSAAAEPVPQTSPRIGAERLEGLCLKILLGAGADSASAEAATRAMMHGSKLGVDSHGIRLIDHYVKALECGRVNRHPEVRIVSEHGAVASLDADDGHGALGAYRAMEHAVELAGTYGIGAVSVRNSSHFGPAGAFAIEAARAGMVGLAFCNSDSFVRLHDGAERFHGTNPIACAVPVAGRRPWLFDMATSAIPYNRVKLYGSLGRALPEGVASGTGGVDTIRPEDVEMLAPLGGEFGFKGAGLAGMVEILSAVFSGMKLSAEILPMNGPDFATPRKLGAFMMALKPEMFVDRAVFDDGMNRYLVALAASQARMGGAVMAPGDREWAEAELREVEGIPLDPETGEALRRLAVRFGLEPPH